MKSSKKYKFGFVMILAMLCVITLCVPVASAEEAVEIYYGAKNDVVPYSIYDETLNYTRKEVLMDTMISMGTPQYFDLKASLPNGCAAIAGGVIVGYYDKEFEDLMPDYESTGKRGEHIIYKPMNSAVVPYMQDLFGRMNVNMIQPGATENDFKNGLRSYVVDHGYNVNYTSYGNSYVVDYEGISQSLQNGIPLALFFDMKYLIYNLQIGDTQLKLGTQPYNASHIAIIYGIKRVRYYNNDSVIRTDTYLSVSSGLMTPTLGHILVERTVVDDIVGVKVY